MANGGEGDNGHGNGSNDEPFWGLAEEYIRRLRERRAQSGGTDEDMYHRMDERVKELAAKHGWYDPGTGEWNHEALDAAIAEEEAKQRGEAGGQGDADSPRENGE